MTRFRATRLVPEISRRPSRMVRAYLAETYDGIGQVVKVQMSLGGITSAFNARIAAGDFGGRRTFPPGTPVILSVVRGSLEVLLGNRPQIIHWEDFNQPTVGGFGESQAGLGPWVLDPFFDEETVVVEGGIATFTGPGGSITPTGTRHAQVYLDVFDTTQPWYSSKFYLETKFRVNVIPIIKSYLNYRITFSDISSSFSRNVDISVSALGSSENFIAIKNSSGSSSFSDEVNWQVDTWYYVGVEIEAGVSLRLYYWSENESKPETPQVTRSDIGAVFTDETNLIVDLFNSARAGIVVTGGSLEIDYLDLVNIAAA